MLLGPAQVQGFQQYGVTANGHLKIFHTTLPAHLQDSPCNTCIWQSALPGCIADQIGGTSMSIYDGSFNAIMSLGVGNTTHWLDTQTRHSPSALDCRKVLE